MQAFTCSHVKEYAGKNADLRSRIRENPKNTDLGSGGGTRGVIFIVIAKKSIALKLRSISLRFFGLLTFGFHFEKPRKPFMLLGVRLFGRVHDSQKELG